MAHPHTQALSPVTLAGRHVVLEPMQRGHAPEISAVFVPGTLALFTKTRDSIEPTTIDAAAEYIEEALEGWERGEYLPFTVRAVDTGQVVGCTRLGDIAMDVPRMEIGWTWYVPGARGTSVNPECKYLLLEHAFESLDAQIVSLRTSHFNERSQAAIRKLGATYDGVIRRHVYQQDGRLRDTMIFSILREDWPQVRSGLLTRIQSGPREG